MIYLLFRNTVRQFSLGRFFCSVALIFSFCASANAETGASICGDLSNGFGPFDYRKYAGTAEWNRHPANDQYNPLYLVHSAHFRPEMESLSHGGQGPKSDVGPELDYTLRAFPNHHRALDAMVRLSDRLKMDQPRGARYTVECWFDRAVRFTPDDVIVRMLYATYLGKLKRLPDALAQLESAAKLDKENPFTNYNIGLIYFELNEFDRALAQAHIAYGLGMQRTDLREKLTASGHWREADAAAAVAVPPASSPASPQ